MSPKPTKRKPEPDRPPAPTLAPPVQPGEAPEDPGLPKLLADQRRVFDQNARDQAATLAEQDRQERAQNEMRQRAAVNRGEAPADSLPPVQRAGFREVVVPPRSGQVMPSSKAPPRKEG